MSKKRRITKTFTFDQAFPLVARSILDACGDLQRFVNLIDAGRAELPDPNAVGRGVAESAFGAIFERLVRTASRGDDVGRARDFVPSLMYLAVRPYLGHAEAMKEFSIPPPPPRRNSGMR